MNRPNDSAPDDFPEAMRWQLRALRRDAEPARDLWPQIAARLPAQAPAARPRRPRWLTPVAMAASVLLVVGAVGWLAQAPNPRTSPSLVQREAESLTAQYQAALLEVHAAPVPASLQATVEALDHDAALIRSALARDPDSLLLLEQLRRTYAHRLQLAQRLAYS